MERINALLAERKDPNDTRSREEIIKATWSIITPIIQAIFADLPDVKIIAVQGYHPWFNDGDKCIWSISTMVDWLGSDDVYYAPCHTDCYDDEPEENEYSSLFTKKDPGWKEREKQPDFANLNIANDLLATLSDEFKILDEENGTAWMFIRDENDPRGFRTEVNTFEHD